VNITAKLKIISIIANMFGFIRTFKRFARTDRVRAKVKRIETDNKRVAALEKKIQQVKKRQAVEAASLDNDVKRSLKIVRDYLSVAEYRDFR